MEPQSHGLLAREHDDALARGRPHALACFAIDRPERLREAGLERDAAAALEGLARKLSPDGIALHRSEDPGAAGERFHALLYSARAHEMTAFARALVEGARALRVGDPPRRLTVTVGLADAGHRSSPSFATLARVAEEGLRVGLAAGGDRFVHSEVYAFFQKEPELRPAAPPAAPLRETLVEPRAPAPSRIGPAPRPESVADRDARLEQLERRVGKLLGALEDAEVQIARLKEHLDEGGLPSVYRTVQGLEPGAAHFEEKRRMMAQIFEQNVGLRRNIAWQVLPAG